MPPSIVAQVQWPLVSCRIAGAWLKKQVKSKGAWSKNAGQISSAWCKKRRSNRRCLVLGAWCLVLGRKKQVESQVEKTGAGSKMQVPGTWLNRDTRVKLMTRCSQNTWHGLSPVASAIQFVPDVPVPLPRPLLIDLTLTDREESGLVPEFPAKA